MIESTKIEEFRISPINLFIVVEIESYIKIVWIEILTRNGLFR